MLRFLPALALFVTLGCSNAPLPPAPAPAEEKVPIGALKERPEEEEKPAIKQPPAPRFDGGDWALTCRWMDAIAEERLRLPDNPVARRKWHERIAEHVATFDHAKITDWPATVRDISAGAKGRKGKGGTAGVMLTPAERGDGEKYKVQFYGLIVPEAEAEVLVKGETVRFEANVKKLHFPSPNARGPLYFMFEFENKGGSIRRDP